MANYTSKILSNAISGLNAQQAMIGITANNIANVNTPNYSKRTMQLEARTANELATNARVGNGVTVGDVTRETNAFLERLVREAAGDVQAFNVHDNFLDRVESLFAFEGEHTTIGTALNAFFAAADDLAINPANIEMRANFIARGEDLVSAIKNTYEEIAGLQDEADQRICTEIETVNSITGQIANLNGLIKTKEASGSLAADERDKRDQLIQKLAEKLSFTITELHDGTVNISLANGFDLVSGTNSRELTVTKSPSFQGPGGAPPSLNGGQLSYIVFDYSKGAGTAEQDLTAILAAGQGSIGGLLQVRGTNAATNTSAFEGQGVLIEIATKIESITRSLLAGPGSLNATYLGDDLDPVTAGWQSSARDLDGNFPAAFGLFTVIGAADSNANGFPDIADLPGAGAGCYSRILQFAISKPRAVAAARIAAAGDPVAEGNGDNILALAAEGSVSRTLGVTESGYNFGGTLSEAYNEMVSRVGNYKNTSRVNTAVAEANLNTAQARRDEVSGVSLDEEFTNLIKYQSAYQAAARLVKVADQLFQEVVNII